MKQIYLDKASAETNLIEARASLTSLKNAFQNISRASKIMEERFNIQIYDCLEKKELDSLALSFAKRHIITHNLSLIDGKYREHVKAWEVPGQEVPLTEKEVEETLQIVKKIILNLL